MHQPTKDELVDVLELQRTDFLQEGSVTFKTRIDRLERAINLLKSNESHLIDAMSTDFGHRSMHQSLFTDIAGSIGPLRIAQKQLKDWMRPVKRKAGPFPLNLLGAKARVEYQPLGVVGVISPWNFPVNLSFGPLMQIFAAGNRAMIKPSEFTEKTSLLTKELVEEYFTPDECAVFTGGPEVAVAFSELPFDHLIFTGSTATGRKVMESAAKNLVPVTLELGGKSPVFLGESADFAKAGERVALGKMLNAGQICLAPDYLYVPESKQDEAIHGVWQGTANMYPTLLDNEDYASVVTDRHFDRLQELVADARDKGAEVIEVNPGNEDFSNTNARKMPLTILKNVNDDMRAMQEEIFGPVLPVKTYRHIDEAIDYVNDHDRPLGLYFFGQDSDEREKVLSRTISGGVTVNDVIFHVSMEDLPFGGVGPSGMGSYHGVEGFREFSHARSIYTQPKIDVAKLGGFKPPYGPATEKAVKTMMK